MKSIKNSPAFKVLSSIALLLGMIAAVPSPAAAQGSIFTMVQPRNNQVVKLDSKSNWFLPVQVTSGTAPNANSYRFTGYFYDSTGSVAASVSWDIGPKNPIATNVNWTFKMGMSNLNYVENPVASNIYVPRDAKSFAKLSATAAPFKDGALKAGTYSFQLFSKDMSNNGNTLAVGDISGLTIGKPNGVKCSPGSFSKTGTWTVAKPCTLSSKGNLVSGIGAKKQTATPAGTKATFRGMAHNMKCMEGTYQPRAGQSTCIQASRGYFASSVGAKAQTKCAIGRYASNLGSFSCYFAEPGNFVASTGQSSQTQCPIGRYQPEFGKGFCSPAQLGYFVPAKGATTMIPCEPGQYQNEVMKGNCKNATPGNYAFGPLNISGDLGYAAETQYQCSPGMFSDGERARFCLNAPPGYFIEISGATFANRCPLGTFNPNEGLDRCENAPIGKYVDTLGATEPIDCPMGTSTLAIRQDSVSDCIPV